MTTSVIYASSVSVRMFTCILTGSHSNVQAVESDYDGDQSAKPLLPPGGRDDDKPYPEEEVNHSRDATTPGRVSYQKYCKPVYYLET